MEFSLKTKKEEAPPETLETKLGELGNYFYTDTFFRERLGYIKSAIENLLPESRIHAMQISEARKEMLKMIKARLLYAWSNVPFGKGIERQWFGRKAMPAARYVILRAQEWVQSDASDDDIQYVIDDVIAPIDNLVGLTFDSQNTSINKSVVVQMVKKDTRYGTEEEEV